MSEAVFQLEANPDDALVQELEALNPLNPFCTAAYFAALRLSRQQTLVPMVRAPDGSLLGGCFATISRGRLVTRIDIPSAPSFRADAILWRGLDKLGVRGEVHRLAVSTFGSEPQSSCALNSARISRTVRSEFWLELAPGTDLLARMSSNHRRNYKRGVKAGYELRCVTDTCSLKRHAELVDASTDRRTGKGSSERSGFGLEFPGALMRAGAARLYQIHEGGDAVASMLALRAAHGVYYHSAGTTPEGMKSGASHFLLHEIARSLQEERITRFNLGGVSPDQGGLRRFKSGFGTTEVPLTATIALYGNQLRHEIAAKMVKVRHLLARS